MTIRRTYPDRQNRREGNQGTLLEELVYKTNWDEVQYTIGGGPDAESFEAVFTSAQADVELFPVPAGLHLVCTQVAAVCRHTNANDVSIRVGFGATATPVAGLGVVLTHGGIAAGSGYNRGCGAGSLGTGDPGVPLRVTCSNPGGDVRVLVSFYYKELP